MTERVSIIIPTYNRAKLVCEAIDSALDQDYDNIEIIVVDDGSTDDTLELLTRRYCINKHPIRIYKKSNGGPASAINYGISKATGDWIHWLSSDDVLKPNAISLMLKAINTQWNEIREKAIFFSHYTLMDEKGNPGHIYLEKDVSHLAGDALKEEILSRYIGNGSTTMIHRNIFKRVGLFDENLPYFEDYDFMLRAVLVHNVRMILIPHFTAKYRLHEGQLTTVSNYHMSLNDTIRERNLRLMARKLT